MANVGYWLYGVAIVVGFCLLVWLTWYALQHRRQPIARTFAAFTLTLAVYSLSIVVITFSDDRDLAYFAARTRMLAASVVYLWYAAVVLDYSGGDGWRFLRRHPYLFIIPAVTSIISLSSKVDEWLFTDWNITPHGPINLETLHYHHFYFVYLAQYYTVALVAFMLLLRQAARRQGLYRRQAIANTAVVILAFLAGAQRNLQIFTEVPNMFPIGLLLLAIVLAWSIFSLQVFKLLPVAYGTIFESMHDAAVVVDQAGRVIDLNPAAKRICRTSSIGQPLSAVLPDVTALLNTTNPDTVQEINLTVDGQPRCYEGRATTLYQMKRHPAGHLLTLTDITKRKQAEREREQMIVALDAYAHTVAHDLKNPIALVVGYASLLHEELENCDAGLRDYTTKIMEASQKNVQIINELLLFASVRRRQDVEVAPIEMGGLVQMALHRLPLETDFPHAQITLSADLPPAIGYAAWLEEVWVNLIGNALKYGGTPPQIEIGGTFEKSRVRYWIRDNGKGLTPDEIQHLLSQEGRLKRHADHEGHGFGLAIVRTIVERLGGSVGIESEVGVGTSFFFTLPAVETSPPGASPPATPAATTHTPPN